MDQAIAGPVNREVLDKRRSLRNTSGNLLDIHRPLPSSRMARKGIGQRFCNETTRRGLPCFWMGNQEADRDLRHLVGSRARRQARLPPKQRFFCHASSSVSPARRSGILVGRCGRAMCCRATAKSLGDLPYEIKENEHIITPLPEPILQLRIGTDGIAQKSLGYPGQTEPQCHPVVSLRRHSLMVLAPTVATYALQPTPDVLHGTVDALRSIPAPQPVEIRPRLFVATARSSPRPPSASSTSIEAAPSSCTGSSAGPMLAASFTLNARGYADVRLGSVMIGLSQLLAVWASALGPAQRRRVSETEPHRWDAPVQAGAATAVWFLAAPFLLPLSAVLYTGPVASALLCGSRSVKFAAPRTADADRRRVHDERRARRDGDAECCRMHS